jgi:hypothetical protein
MSNTTLGSYSPFSAKISTEDKEIFINAFEKFAGVNYEPIAVAKQVVAGENYAFFCNATPVYPGASSNPAMVTIFKSLEGHSSITHIEKISY